MTEEKTVVQVGECPPPKRRYDWDDVDLGILTIGGICVILIILFIVLLLTMKQKPDIGGLLGVIGMGITAIATLAGRRVKSTGDENVDKL